MMGNTKNEDVIERNKARLLASSKTNESAFPHQAKNEIIHQTNNRTLIEPKKSFNRKRKNISIHNRFVGIIIVFFGIFILFALYTDKAARVTVDDSQLQIRNLQDVGIAVGDISNSLHLLGIAMYQATLFNKDDQPEVIQLQLSSLAQQVSRLINFPSVQSNPELNQPALHLADSLRGLTVQAQKMLEISGDYELKYPAMPIMLNKLRPLNHEMVGLLTVSIDEARGLIVRQDEQEKVLILLRDFRYIWSQLVSSVRVFVANRLGAFGPPEQTMMNIQRDRQLYAEVITDMLKQLDEFNQDENLGLVQQDALSRIKVIHNEYQAEFLLAKAIYLSDNWRADKALLRDDLTPSLDEAWSQVFLISNRINAHSQFSMGKYATTADTFSNYIWIAVLTFMGLLLLGYLSFEYLIRRPIIAIAKALDAEGNGQSIMPSLKFRVKETDVLLNAFGGMRHQIHARQARLQSILDNACEGIFTLSTDGEIEVINKSACQLFGYKEEELINQRVTLIIPAYAFVSNEFNVDIHNDIANKRANNSSVNLAEFPPIEKEILGLCKNGKTFSMSLRVGKTIIEGKTIFTALVSDISERKLMIDRLTQLAERDSLTGLYNRHFLMDELERIVDRSSRGESQNIALLYIDLDHFKYVNDTLGHIAGDTVLQEVTKILQQRARGTDLVTRLGGDEFAIILYEVDESQAKAAASAYLKQLADYTFCYEGQAVDIGCSIGVVIYDEFMKSKEDLLSRADLACHLAKQSGRNRVKVCTPRDRQDDNTLSLDVGWSRRIKHALENDEFFQHSQPIIDAKTGNTLSNEVFIRLKDKKQNIIMPSGFLPSVERFGLSVELDCWVIKKCFKQLSEQSSLNRTGYSINLSAQAINNESILKVIEDAKNQFKIDPSHIIFEIMESSAINQMEQAKKFLNSLHALGFKTSLDDFGVCYSSFNLLNDLPVDYIKLNGAFIQSFSTDKVKVTMLKAMNEVAHVLGIKTVAEFVEDGQTLALLKEIGVDYCQGFYMGRPASISDIESKTNVLYLTSNL